MDHLLNNIKGTKSQNWQDLWVSYESDSMRDGYFVEFGSTDGVWLSNTYYLEKTLGWKGILAEPCQRYRSDLPKNRDCSLDFRCVWSKSGDKILFNETNNAELSTIDQFSDSDGHAGNRANGKRYEVETVSLDDLLEFHRAPRKIDYLSVDTEGSELDILSAFSWDQYDVRLITVEHNYTPAREKIYDLLTSKGYERRFQELSKTDDWYVRKHGES